jgi:hypothetical protein
LNIRPSDYLLVRLADQAESLLRSLGDLETAWLRRRLRDISIESPVFIAGLARSGTTILLGELSKLVGFGTHRYRDFPFVMTPWLWNRFLDRFQTGQPARERPHKDRICITPESPEAFEEPIWQHFFPQVHAANRSHRLTSAQPNREFDAFFTDHIRKLLLVRHAGRYLSKGNYNVARIEYLARLFPDAKFIIPIRHPFAHVQSLLGQHALFGDYARMDRRVARYLAAAGHYEFGPQRMPIRLTNESGDRIAAAWNRGDDGLGYAIQWAEIYRFVDALRSESEALANRILFVRYEDFCSQPDEEMCRILRFLDMDTDIVERQQFGHIVASTLGTLACSDEFAPASGARRGQSPRASGMHFPTTSQRRGTVARSSPSDETGAVISDCLGSVASISQTAVSGL